MTRLSNRTTPVAVVSQDSEFIEFLARWSGRVPPGRWSVPAAYFPAIDHEILKTDLRRRIACRRTLAVLDRIIDGSNPQEPVHLYYAGDAA